MTDSAEHPQPHLTSGSRRSFRRLLGSLLLPAALLAVLLLTFVLSRHSLSDTDIWLHWRTGCDIVAGRGIPSTNSYSHTAPGHEWIDHEWLFQVITSVVAGEASPTARAARLNHLRIFLALVIVSVMLLGDQPRGRKWPSSRRIGALALPTIVCLAMLWPRFLIRPELFSYLAFILILRRIDGALDEGTGRPQRLPFLRPSIRWSFLLTALWAQFHGFYILAPALWLLATCLHPLSRRLDRPETPRFSPAWPLAAALTFLAGLLTPNLLGGLLYPFQALGQFGSDGIDLTSDIAEMIPLLEAGASLSLTILVFKLSLIWAGLWIVATAGRVSLLRIAVLILAAAATFQAQRSIGFYALTFFLIHSGYRSERRLLPAPLYHRIGFLARLVHTAPTASTLAAITVAALWLPALASDSFYLREGVSRRSGAGLTPALFPFSIVDSLAAGDTAPDTRLYNNIDVASTLIAERAGRVFIDGRTEAYPEAVWRHYKAIRAGGEQALELLLRHNPALIILGHYTSSSTRLLATLLQSPDWYVYRADECAVVFRPAGTRAAEQCRAATAATLRRARQTLLASLKSTGGTRDADRCLALGSLLAKAGDAEADTIYRKGLQLKPGHPNLNHNLGNLLLAAGKHAEALTRFETALAVNHRLIEPRINAGICHFQLGDIVAAEECFTEAVRRNDNSLEAWVNLAEAGRRRGNRADALAAYDRAVALRPDDFRLRRRAAEYRAGAR